VFEDTKSESDNTMAKRKWTKGQTTIYKTLNEKPKIEQHESHQKPGGGGGGRELICPEV
jgi:hypothetical protein